MTEAMLRAVLETAQAKADDGWSALPAGRHLTLYVAHAGVPLTVGKIERVASQGGLLRAKNVKGETFVLAIEDVFAAAVDAGEAATSRKAGFLG